MVGAGVGATGAAVGNLVGVFAEMVGVGDCVGSFVGDFECEPEEAHSHVQM